MYSLRLLLPWLFLVLLSVEAFAQTAATGSVTVAGSLQGPIYPCGNRSCATYDSGQIAITINGFTATTNYSHASNQKSANQLAVSLTNLLNGANSPVTATVSKAKISLVSKAKGTTANYPLSTAVTHSASFANPSFTAIASGPSLTGGSGGPTPIGTLINQLSNNTSLCSSSNDPGGNLPFCSAFFDGFNTNPNDLGAETLVPNAPAGHISPLSAKQLMYPGWTGRLICEYQPWFGLASHKSVGYNENLPSTVGAQNSFMITEGCDINLVDFYGALNPNQSFNLATTNAVFADLNSRSGFPLKFGIMEDKGALTATCPTSNQTEAATVTCLQNALITEVDYINIHYASSGVYLTDNGNPLIFTFIPPSTWPVLTSADWTTIWTAVKAHTDTYVAPFKYIFQFGSFTTNAYDNGRFGWVQPATYDATKQFWWGSNTNASPIYLDNLYSAGIAHPSQLTVGVIYKGFDDNNASWSGNRVMAQQCGQVLLKTASEISKYFGGTKPQIPYVQIATWNDYEEGTSVEDGIDNCYTVSTSLTGNQLTWSLVASDSTYASPSTVHHFNVYYTDVLGNLYSAASNLAVTANALDLSTLIPSGTWNVYVEMVGQPLIINRMSSALTYIR
ncbi:MAG: hypothetical protein DMG93_13605 [Acidobacteria bacterium]|nr:MAG: hypothetical protein DMG93_13605 [Acidobacteriota bacterium]